MSAVSKIPQNRPSRLAGPSKLPGRILRPAFANRPQSSFASSVNSAKQHERRENDNFSCQKSTESPVADPNQNIRLKSPKSNRPRATSATEFDENTDTKSKTRPAFVDCNGNKNNYRNDALGNIKFVHASESSWLNTNVEIENDIVSSERQTKSVFAGQESTVCTTESGSDWPSFRSMKPGYFLQKVSEIKSSHQKANAEKLNLVKTSESRNEKPAPDPSVRKQTKSLPLPSKMSGQGFTRKSRFGYKTETPVLSDITKSPPLTHSHAGMPRSRMSKTNTDNVETTVEVRNSYVSRAEKRKRQIEARNAQSRLEENQKTSVSQQFMNGGSQDHLNILSESENTAANVPLGRPYFGNQRRNHPRIAKPVARPKKLDSPASDAMPTTPKFDETVSRVQEEFSKTSFGYGNVERRKNSEERATGVRSQTSSDPDFDSNRSGVLSATKEESRYVSSSVSLDQDVKVNSPSTASQYSKHGSETNDIKADPLPCSESTLHEDREYEESQCQRYTECNTSNKNIVTYGRYRTQAEGNYSTEQKYGASERRLIRSSASSDGVDQDAPLRKINSTSEQKTETTQGTREKIPSLDSACERTNPENKQSDEVFHDIKTSSGNSAEGAVRSFKFSATSEITVFSAGIQSPEPYATNDESLPEQKKLKRGSDVDKHTRISSSITRSRSAPSVNNSTSKAKKCKTDSLLMSPLSSETEDKQTDSFCSQHNENPVEQQHVTVIQSSSLEREICFEDDPEDDDAGKEWRHDDEENLSALIDLSSLHESVLITDFPSLLDEEDSFDSTGNENEVDDQTKGAFEVKDTNAVCKKRVTLSSDMQHSCTVQTNVINKLLSKGLNGIVRSEDDILPSTRDIGPLKPYAINGCTCDNHEPDKSVTSDTSGDRAISIDELQQEQRVFRMSLEKLYHILQEEEAKTKMYTGEIEKLRKENDTLKHTVEELTQKLNDVDLARESPQVKECSVQTNTPTKWYRSELRDKVQSAIKVASKEIKFLKALHDEFDKRTDGADETLQNALELIRPEESTDN